MRLLSLLCQYDKNELSKLIPDIQNLVGLLLGNLKGGASIDVFLYFLDYFGMNFMDNLPSNKKWSNQDKMLTEASLAILKGLETEGNRKRLLGFILKRAPSISYSWKLYDALLNDVPSFIDSISSNEIFEKTWKSLLSSRTAWFNPSGPRQSIMAICSCQFKNRCHWSFSGGYN